MSLFGTLVRNTGNNEIGGVKLTVNKKVTPIEINKWIKTPTGNEEVFITSK